MYILHLLYLLLNTKLSIFTVLTPVTACTRPHYHNLRIVPALFLGVGGEERDNVKSISDITVPTLPPGTVLTVFTVLTVLTVRGRIMTIDLLIVPSTWVDFPRSWCGY